MKIQSNLLTTSIPNTNNKTNIEKVKQDPSKATQFSATIDFDNLNLYTKKGVYQTHTPVSSSSLDFFNVDKGTAIATTVNVNRQAFDQILYATTYGETKWEEMGVDDEKCWVVINGQRFESEHSPEEKALRKRARMSLVDILNEIEAKSKPKTNEKDKNKTEPTGNLDALRSNTMVMTLLRDIFGTDDDNALMKQLA